MTGYGTGMRGRCGGGLAKRNSEMARAQIRLKVWQTQKQLQRGIASSCSGSIVQCGNEFVAAQAKKTRRQYEGGVTLTLSGIGIEEHYGNDDIQSPVYVWNKLCSV
jgi:hypothetical protein